MAHRLAELYHGLDDSTLRELFLEIVRVLPESRDVTTSFLHEHISDMGLRRTVSVDNIVVAASGFRCSSIASKTKGRKQKVRSNGHTYVCHNYTKPTFCAVCGEHLNGLTHQGYQCKGCLMDVHPHCVNALWKCRGVELAKARKKNKKTTKRKNYATICDEEEQKWRPADQVKNPNWNSTTAVRSKFLTVRLSTSTSDGMDIPNLTAMTPEGSDTSYLETGPEEFRKSNLSGASVDASNQYGSVHRPTMTEPPEALASPLIRSKKSMVLTPTQQTDSKTEDTPESKSQSTEEKIAPNIRKSQSRSPYSNVIDDQLIPEQFPSVVVPENAVTSEPPSPRISSNDTDGVIDDLTTPQLSGAESDSDSEYFEENSSDGGSSDDDDCAYGGNRINAPMSRRESIEHSIRIKYEWKTGAAADWKRHGASFKARLSDTLQHNETSLGLYLGNSDKLEKEFANVPENRVNILTTPKLTEAKNRYMNILPNNHSRVVLSQIGNDETSSYINANWIQGFPDAIDEFIACQGPMDVTVTDFWRMLWETGVHVVVMNTGITENGKDKCVRYWPEKADGSPEATLIFGDFSIETYACDQVTPEFQCSSLRVTYKGETRLLKHFWWTDWPDKGVPKNSNGIYDFITSIRAAQVAASGPVVVHCSAGIGRTGCFLTINYCMKQYDANKYVDILNCVGKLRQDRGMTVQTESQYRYIHQVLLKYMQGTLSQRDESVMRRDTIPVHETDTARIRVIKAIDRPLGNLLARKSSSRGLISNLVKRKSSKEMMVVASPSPVPSPKVVRAVKSAPPPVVGQSFSHGNHMFKAKTFVRPTPCFVCGEILSGLALQGLRCSECKQDCHFWCLEKVSQKCILATNVKRQKSGLPSWPPTRPDGSGINGSQRSIYTTGLMAMEE